MKFVFLYRMQTVITAIIIIILFQALTVNWDIKKHIFSFLAAIFFALPFMFSYTIQNDKMKKYFLGIQVYDVGLQSALVIHKVGRIDLDKPVLFKIGKADHSKYQLILEGNKVVSIGGSYYWSREGKQSIIDFIVKTYKIPLKEIRKVSI